MTWNSPSARAFSRWAQAFQLGAASDLLMSTLGVDDAQVDYLGTILKRLVAVNPILQAWASEGASLFGLAELAQALADDPAFVGALPRRQTEELVMERFRGQAQTHYLYMSWILRDPIEPAAIPWVDVFRLWLLVQALERAAGPTHLLSDALLEAVCRRLRTACEENDAICWLHAVRQLAVPTGNWWMLGQGLRHADERLRTAHLDNLLDAERLPWLRTVARVARGESRRSAAATVTDAAAFMRRNKSLAALLPASNWVLPSPKDDEFPQVLPISLGDDPEDDEEQGLQLLEVDPEAPVAVQELTGRYIQLLSGADARYLPWDRSALTPPERLALDAHLQLSLRSEDPSLRLMGALVSTAQSLGRSLELTSRIPIVREAEIASSNDWRIDLDNGFAVRPAPRRVGHWLPGHDEAAHVKKYSDRLALALPEEVVRVLREAWRTSPHASHLNDLWDATGKDRLRSAFLEWRLADPRLQRITQGMLGPLLGRDIFARTQDHVLARLVASSADSGLPAATAYTAYLASQLDGLHRDTGQTTETNVAGGLLDPVDSFLRDRFAQEHRELVRLSRSGELPDFHNAVTRYWDATWRAATGIRPHARESLIYHGSARVRAAEAAADVA